MIENISFLSTLLFVLVFTLLAMRVPIGVALGLPAVVVIFLKEGQVSGLAIAVISAMEDKFLLTAIPFFILASVFLTSGGASARIVKFAVSLVGHMRGGMAASGVVSCTLFAALSGSSPATVAAMGPLSIQGMRELPSAAGGGRDLYGRYARYSYSAIYCDGLLCATNESSQGVYPGRARSSHADAHTGGNFLHRSGSSNGLGGLRAVSRNGQRAFGLLLILIRWGYTATLPRPRLPLSRRSMRSLWPPLYAGHWPVSGVGLTQTQAKGARRHPQPGDAPLVPLGLFHRDTKKC